MKPSLRLSSALAAAALLTSCGDKAPTAKQIIETAGSCKPEIGKIGSAYPTDKSFEDGVLQRFEESASQSELLSETWEDFSARGGELYGVCFPGAELDPNNEMFLRNAMYKQDPSLSIYASATYGEGATPYLGHELHHHDQHMNGHENQIFFTPDQLMTFEAVAGKELLLEVTAQVAATDFVFEQFLKGNETPMIALLNMNKIEARSISATIPSIDMNVLENAPHVDIIMAKTYMAEIIGWDADPSQLTMQDIRDAKIDTSPEARNKARAAAFSTYFGVSPEDRALSSRISLQENHNKTYVANLLPYYVGQFRQVAGNEAMFGVTVDHGGNPPKLFGLEDLDVQTYAYVGDENYGEYLHPLLKSPEFLRKYVVTNAEAVTTNALSKIALEGYIETGKPPTIFLREYMQEAENQLDAQPN